MKPGIYDLTIYQGANFELQLTWRDADNEPIDLTGYQARLQVRVRPSAEDVLMSLTETDGIVLAATSPNIVISRTPAQTAALSWDDAVYNLELDNGSGDVSRLLEGLAILSPEVAR